MERSACDIERLLTPDSILERAMRCCVLGKDTLRLFPIDAKQSIPVAVVRPDKKLRKKQTNMMPYVGVVQQTQSVCFIRTKRKQCIEIILPIDISK